MAAKQLDEDEEEKEARAGGGAVPKNQFAAIITFHRRGG